MNYQAYDWYFNANSAPTTSTTSTTSDPWQSSASTTCVGDTCCSTGQTFDASNNICVTTTESFMTESMINSVLTKKDPNKNYKTDYNVKQPQAFNHFG
jgi:hypothetical protein